MKIVDTVNIDSLVNGYHPPTQHASLTIGLRTRPLCYAEKHGAASAFPQGDATRYTTEAAVPNDPGLSVMLGR
jgi:hypothetical protein